MAKFCVQPIDSWMHEVNDLMPRATTSKAVEVALRLQDSSFYPNILVELKTLLQLCSLLKSVYGKDPECQLAQDASLWSPLNDHL